MIPHPHRQKGPGPQLGARGPGGVGPYGRWPDALEDDEPDGGGGLDDEQHDHDDEPKGR